MSDDHLRTQTFTSLVFTQTQKGEDADESTRKMLETPKLALRCFLSVLLLLCVYT